MIACEYERKHPNSKKLYKHCETIHYNSDAFEENNFLYIYAPKNTLDTELFNNLISNQCLLNEKIIIAKKIEPFGFVSQFMFGIINNKLIKKCDACGLQIPIDMFFYSNANNLTYSNEEKSYNLCRVCCSDKSKSNKLIVRSGAGFISDWICICSILLDCEDINIFCNLNKKSIHYGKFAVNIYIEMLGYEFKIVKNTTIEKLIKRYI